MLNQRWWLVPLDFLGCPQRQGHLGLASTSCGELPWGTPRSGSLLPAAGSENPCFDSLYVSLFSSVMQDGLGANGHGGVLGT